MTTGSEGAPGETPPARTWRCASPGASRAASTAGRSRSTSFLEAVTNADVYPLKHLLNHYT
jgi:hypothetical protein